jgi:hypothetical protein
MLHGPLGQEHFGRQKSLAAGGVDAAMPPDFDRTELAFNHGAIGKRPGIRNFAGTAAAGTAKAAARAFEFSGQRLAGERFKADPATLWPQAVF